MKAFLITIAVAIGLFFAAIIGVGVGAGIKHQNKNMPNSNNLDFEYEILSDEDTSIDGSRSRLIKIVASQDIGKNEMVQLSRNLATDTSCKYTIWFYKDRADFEDGRAYTLGMIDIYGDEIKHTEPIFTAPKTNNASESTPTSSQASYLEVKDFDFEVDEYHVYAIGKITNTFDRPLRYLAVRINLYDASGNIIGSTLDNITYVAPGDTWSFRALILEDNVANVKVVDIEYSH